MATGAGETEVQISAKIDDAVAAVKELGGQFSAFATATAEQFARVNAAADDVNLHLAAMTVHAANTGESFKRLEHDTNGMAGGTASHIKAMVQVSGEQLEHLNLRLRDTGQLFSKFGELFLVYFGGEKLLDMVSSTSELADHLQKLAVETGMSAESLQGWQYAAKIADVSADGLERGLRRLAQGILSAQVVTSASNQITVAFQQLGITAQQLQGMNLDTVLSMIADKFQQMADGQQKMAIAGALFGTRFGEELIPLLNKGAAGIDALKERARELGVVLSGEAVDQLSQTRDNLKDLDTAAQGLKETLAVALNPVLGSLAHALTAVSEGADNADRAMSSTSVVVRGVTAAFASLAGGLMEVAVVGFAPLVAIVNQTIDLFATFGRMYVDLTERDMKGVAETWREYSKRSADYWEQAAHRIMSTSQLVKQTILGMFVPGVPDTNAQWSAPGHAPTAPMAPSRLVEWKSQLEQLKDAAGNFNEFSKEQEVQFWESKLALAKKGSKEYEQVFHELVTARRAAAKEELDAEISSLDYRLQAAKNHKDEQMRIMDQEVTVIRNAYGEDSKEYANVIRKKEALAQQWAAFEERVAIDRVKAQTKASLAELDADKLALQGKLKLREISNAQLIAAEKELENERYTIQYDALQRELAIAEQNPNKDPRLVERINGQIYTLEQTHLKQMTALQQQAAEEAAKFETKAAASVQGAFTTFLTDITDRTKTLSQAMRDLASSIEQAISKMAASGIAQDLFGPGTKGGGFVSSFLQSIFPGAHKDAGGFVAPGQSYFIGVPEVFTPTTSGYMTPVSQMKGSVVVQNTFHVAQPASKQTQMQIAAAAGKSIQLAMSRNG